jgi:hypothetical protein
MHILTHTMNRTPLVAGMLLAVFFLCGCQKWTASERPISGVKLVVPLYDSLGPGEKLVISGSSLDGSVALDSLVFGIRYKMYPWLNGENSIEAQEELAIVKRVKLDNAQSAFFADSVYLPQNVRPGRYEVYSVVKNIRGQASDTNRVYRWVFAPWLYPRPQLAQAFVYTILSSANNFNQNQGQNLVQITETAKGALPADSVVVNGVVRSKSPLTRAELSLCRPRNGGVLECTLQRTVILVGDTSLNFNYKIELPLSAQTGELYRARVRFVNSAERAFAVQPLYQITTRP